MTYHVCTEPLAVSRLLVNTMLSDTACPDKGSVWVPSAQEVFLLPYVFKLSLENS